ncbi:MAG TPA: hypothetical protein VK179_07060 [Bacteroidales bacterium]|nr:hypothetical protein [Bacteroidales bacterium]
MRSDEAICRHRKDFAMISNHIKPLYMRYFIFILMLIPTQTALSQQTDSITGDSAAREQFVLDSVLARERFVQDSLARHQRIHDSVVFLKNELNRLLPAYYTATADEIILRFRDMSVIGDTAVSDFVCITMPFSVRDPFTPWKTRFSADNKIFKYKVDERSGQLISFQTPRLKATFNRSGRNLLVIFRPVIIQNNSRGMFYKNPVDSVFYNNQGQIITVRSYVQFYALLAGNQRGNLLFTNHTETRNYEYAGKQDLKYYTVARYCERWKAYEPNKVCSTIHYTISREGNTYTLVRKNEPVNNFSDGTYTLKYDGNEDLNEISFINAAKTENWQRTIELNKNGNVSCYYDKANGQILQSLCMVYKANGSENSPDVVNSLETITTTFEMDGISYYQKNNTTGKIRTRDRMTLEWSPWK